MKNIQRLLTIAGSFSLFITLAHAQQPPGAGVGAAPDPDCRGVTDLSCYDRPLTNLNLSGCTNLQTVYCYNARLTNLNVSGCTGLQSLECASNDLRSLDLSCCVNLQTLYCYDNRLTNLEVTTCGNLKELHCDNNLLTNVSLSACIGLRIVDCSRNRITDLSSFVANSSRGGLGEGDCVLLSGNPLNDFARTNQIPYLTNRGVTVQWP